MSTKNYDLNDIVGHAGIAAGDHVNPDGFA
jgi:hypothetical protein